MENRENAIVEEVTKKGRVRSPKTLNRVSCSQDDTLLVRIYPQSNRAIMLRWSVRKVILVAGAREASCCRDRRATTRKVRCG